MSSIRSLAAALLITTLLGACAIQPRLSPKKIDELVIAAMQEFSVPGVAVGVIKDGIVVHAAGYGVRELGLDAPVDTETLFRIASTSKAFTTASLAMLVDEGKLDWNDKVVDHIPDFALYDPWVTQEFTILDLLTHRSGLVSGAGDLMLWPKPNAFTREDIIHGLRYFKPESAFRTEYAYDNLLYIVGGELVPAVTGMAWEDFVDERILGKLGVTRCFAGRIPESQMQNLAAPHAIIEGELRVVDRNRASAEVDVAAAAGGVRCSLQDMLKWTRLQLAHGELPDGSVLFSEQQSRIMWSPQTILGVDTEAYERDRTHFKAYALGWRLADVLGYKHVSHTGSYTGFRAHVILVPELDLGVVILLNASSSSAREAIAQGIVKAYMGSDDVDWVARFAREVEPETTDEPEIVTADPDFRHGSVLAPHDSYAGLYRDAWFGDVSIEMRGDELWFASAKSPTMQGRLWPFEDNTFYAYWTDRTLEADAWVKFEIDEAGYSGRMELVPVWDDSDWDLSDLDLRRVEDD
ncbi:MAG: serine hydrolase [Gammaproteobacteria bacterium]|nr:serine hydrolase [Gammaproteobacteria bacterium]